MSRTKAVTLMCTDHGACGKFDVVGPFSDYSRCMHDILLMEGWVVSSVNNFSALGTRLCARSDDVLVSHLVLASTWMP